MTDPNATPPYDPASGQPTPPQQGQPTPPPGYQAPPPGYQAPPPGYQQPGYQQPGYQQQPGYPPTAGAAPLTQAEDKQWAMWSHIGGVLFVLPPLIIWLVFKDRGPLTNQEGKESLNFQITMAIIWVAYSIINVILGFIPIVGFIIGTLLWLALLAVQIAFPIIGGVKVNNGGTYRYPFNFRFIK